MAAVANVTIHPSQFPGEVRRALLESLHRRQIHHKFLYDGFKQTRKWLALHQAYSPSRVDADCEATYDAGFAAAAAEIQSERIHLVGLGCGGGKKDARLLELLGKGGGQREETEAEAEAEEEAEADGLGKGISYTPVDVSVAMVLEARRSALRIIPPENCLPLVCDLAAAEELPALFEQLSPHAVRLFTFFGMLPNFDPQMILPRLASLLRKQDLLLVSANLAPGSDYGAGVARILPLYDNELTRDWLMSFLLDLGFGLGDGGLRFGIEEAPKAGGAKRIVAQFVLNRRCEIMVEGERFEFQPGESIRVFFSYRYTPALVESLLAEHGLRCRQQWVSGSEEEGVFLFSGG